MTDTLIELRGVTKRYADGAPPVLHDIDLDIAAGESVAIVGPSGCGKSTLLHIIGALLEPSAGTVHFAGTDLTTLDADATAALRNRELGFVFQAHHLLPQCTALENVLLPTLVATDRAQRQRAQERARTLLADVGLGDRADHRPGQLSGGECQRVAVVRALINEPRALLADEPTGSLDGANAEHLADLLVELNAKDRVALVVVTHSERLAARMQRCLELRAGALAEAAARA
ncbi:MAG: ABC transporter ATP-binding protein [Planctomycetota bacterium]